MLKKFRNQKSSFSNQHIKDYKKYIIDLKQNYNWGSSSKNYINNFASNEILFYLPAIIDFCNSSYFDRASPKILDLGCGLGPMAFAYKLYFEEFFNDKISYVGIDINRKAIEFLSNAYPKNFYFHLHDSGEEVNYVGKNLKGDMNKTTSHSDGNECNYNIGFNFKSDIQWSSSFFTHLTPRAADKSLNFIKENLSKEGISFNSWLIVDTFSKASMKIGKLDRQLNYDFGEYLSYSDSNPLVCTAFKIDFIKEIYKKNNMEILSILRGSWRGGMKNKFNHYQDIIISRLIK